MIPPSTWLDFALAAVALGGSYWWRVGSQSSAAARKRGTHLGLTVLFLLGVSGLLYFTLVRFGFVDAVLTPERGFGYGPFWRVLPAIAAEITSVLLLSSALVRRSERFSEPFRRS